MTSHLTALCIVIMRDSKSVSQFTTYSIEYTVPTPPVMVRPECT
jgi:hypothetical protein